MDKNYNLENDKYKNKSMLVMFLLSAIYLIPEIIFNATLVSKSSHLQKIEELEAIEYFGRTVSGIGLSLMVASILIAKFSNNKNRKSFLIFILSFLLCWPFMFYGQKLLVDYLATNSTPEQRRDSYLSYGIKDALRTGTLKINNITYTGNKGDYYDDTFLVLIGGIIFYNDEVLNFFSEKKEDILNFHYNNEAADSFSVYYNDYKNNRDLIRSKFKEYQEGSVKFNNSLSDVPIKQNEAWLKMTNEMTQGWKDLQNYRNAFNGRVEARAIKVGPFVFDNVNARNRCQKTNDFTRRQNCLDNLSRKYDQEMAKYGLHNTSIRHWIENGGVTNDITFYSKKIREIMLSEYVKETGYDYGVDNYTKFKSHKTTADKIRRYMDNNYGIKISKNWNTNDKVAFNQAIDSHMREIALNNWKKEIEKEGLTLNPNLSWNDFQRHSDIQNIVKSRIGNENYLSTMLFDWNDEDFKNKYYIPLMKKRIDESVKKFSSDISNFEVGGSLYEDSKSTLKGVLIPPISMIISLFLIIFTSFNLIKKSIYYFVEKVFKIDMKNIKIKLVLGSFSLILFYCLVFVLPFNIQNKEMEDNKALEYMLSGIDPKLSYSINWALHTQPLVQSMGYEISQKIDIYKYFKN